MSDVDIRFMDSVDLSKGSVLVIMVGPPSSGKTPIANKLVEDYSFEKISPEDVRAELNKESGSVNIDDYLNRNREVFAIVYSRLSEALRAGKNVVYDATNCRSWYRTKIMEVVKGSTTKVLCFVMKNRSVMDCIKKHEENNMPYLTELTIEKMWHTLRKQPPTIMEGYDAIVAF